jgi:ABC-type multidrug transport system fused ATPase/permease subunit
MKYLKRIKNFLTSQEQRQAFFIIILTFIMSLFDMIGVASILPFVTILTNPQLLQSNDFFKSLYDFTIFFGVNNQQDFLFTFGAFVFFLLIFSLIIKALTVYLQIRFTLMREYSIGKQLIEKYLHQPYSWFLSRNSSELGKNILSEVSITINEFFMPIMNLVTNFFIVLLLLLMLVFVEPFITIITVLTFATLYGIIFILVKNYLDKIGEKKLFANHSRFRILSESFGSPKEMKLKALEKDYTELFGNHANNFAIYQSHAQIISRLPRFLIEAVAFGGMLLVMLFLISEKGSFSSALPIISLYAFAGYRLIPAIQQLYIAITQIRYSYPSFNNLYNEFEYTQSYKIKTTNKLNTLILKNYISLENIFYTYPNSSSQTLKNINLKIKAKTKVAFVGSTGSGKTTTVDVILGLLQADKGTLKIDDTFLNDSNSHYWQKNIGYVPQQIYLTDDTIAANIAFGTDLKKIDHQRIEEVGKLANLHNFILENLPKKYQTIVGERGVRLSGGQRQRIGIARALYQNPKILVFDEATNSLDNITEKKIMETIYNLYPDKTILIIAHRLSTIKQCDQIILIEEGEIRGQGTYEELINSNQTFKKMAEKEIINK